MRQYRDSKREESVKVVTLIYFEIQKILSDLLTDMSSSIYLSSKEFFQEWGKIKGTRDQIRVSKVNMLILPFYEECEYYFELLTTVYRKVESVINEAFNEQVCKPRGYLLDTDNQVQVTIRYETYIDTRVIFLAKYAIFGINPIDHDDIDNLFTKEKSWLEFQPHIIQDGGYRNLEYKKIPYDSNESIFVQLFESLEERLGEEDYIKELRRYRIELKSMAVTILDSISSFIE
jgi:hypothetical protein